MITVTVNNCDCPPVEVITDAELCNQGNATLDLTSLEINTDPGTWIFFTTPSGTINPTITVDQFDATGADEGTYELVYVLDGTVPDGCKLESKVVDIVVYHQASAGTVTGDVNLCSDDDMVYVLADYLNGEDVGGEWLETGLPTTNGAFDKDTGTFIPSGQTAGLYTFNYFFIQKRNMSGGYGRGHHYSSGPAKCYGN